jgi:signal transduction histidine kinase
MISKKIISVIAIYFLSVIYMPNLYALDRTKVDDTRRELKSIKSFDTLKIKLLEAEELFDLNLSIERYEYHKLKGDMYARHSQYDLAIVELKQALANLNGKKYDGNRGTLYAKIAESFEHSRILDSALYYSDIAFECFDLEQVEKLLAAQQLTPLEINYLDRFGFVTSGRYFVLKTLEMYQAAYDLFQWKIKIIEKIGTPKDKVTMYMNAGNISVKVVSPEKADSVFIHYYQLAENIAVKNNLTNLYGRIYTNLSRRYYVNDDFKKSIEYSEKAMEYFGEDNLTGTMEDYQFFHSMFFAGAARYELREISNALEMLSKTQQFLEKNTAAVQLYPVYEYIAFCYMYDGPNYNADSAKKYVKKFVEIIKKIDSDKHKKSLAAYEVELETEKAKKEAEKNKAIAESEEKQNLYLTIGIFISIISLIIAMILLISNRKSKIQLMELSKVKDGFISLMAHDIRNPLANLLSSINVLRDFKDQMSEENKDSTLEIMNKSANNLLNLLNDILKWMKASTNGIEITKESTMIEAILLPPISLLGASAAAKQIEIVNVAENQTKVIADTQLMTTVIRNLIHNAIKFSNTGSQITVSTDKFNEKYIRLSIVDEGVGISPDILNDLFKMNKKTSTYGTAGEAGSGFGLQMSREFLLKHGSELSIESEVGKGTKVFFDLELA